MHVKLIVHHELDPDAGAPGSIHSLCKKFRALGHEADIYSFSDLPSGVSLRRKAAVFPLYVARYIARARRAGSVDVIDASTADAWLWATIARRHDSLLLVTRSHGLEHVAHLERLESARRGEIKLSWRYPLYWGGIHLREVAVSLRRADLVLFLNRHDLDYAIDTLGVDPRRARVVTNGIPDSLLALPLDPTPPNGADPIKIAQIGSYLPSKGVAFGARALHEILHRHPDVRVTFLGTGIPAKATLADFSPGFHERITVIPHFARNDLPSLLSGHHIKLFPTLSEGFGNALLEAMACGLAPVTTATPGPLVFAADGANAMVVPPRDSRALVGALDRLILDAALLDRLRRNAHATAQRFSWTESARHRLALYEEFLERRGHSR